LGEVQQGHGVFRVRGRRDILVCAAGYGEWAVRSNPSNIGRDEFEV
jgi:hypothetical protein